LIIFLITVGFSRQKGKLHHHWGLSPNGGLVQEKYHPLFFVLKQIKSSKRKFKTNRSFLAQGHVHPGDSPTGPMREGEP
jgi:hypothetical protein